MDYVQLVVDHLNSSGIGATAYPQVPSERPSEFAVVEQMACPMPDLVRRLPSVDVDCWAGTRHEAASLAYRVAEAILLMPDQLQNVFGAAVTTVYDNRDPDSGSPRYTVSVDLTVAD